MSFSLRSASSATVFEFRACAHRFDNIIGAESAAHQTLAKRGKLGGGQRQPQGADFLLESLLQQFLLAGFRERLFEGRFNLAVINEFGFQLAADAVAAVGAVADQRGSVVLGKLLIVQVVELAEAGNRLARLRLNRGYFFSSARRISATE